MGNRSSRGGVFQALSLLTCLCLAAPVYAESEAADLAAIEEAFVTLAEKVSPSVVAIETNDTTAKSNRGKSSGKQTPMIGSGVIIDSEGLILTNEHVVHYGDEIIVVLDGGRRFKGEVLSRDVRSDLAVIKIDVHDLTPAELCDLARVQVGQWALAMGNPYNLSRDGRPALSYGIVSALGKSLPTLEENGKKYYGNLIQTTATINPGNSGGPLFNIRGELIGINTAIETSSGAGESLGFAIPISARTRRIIEVLSSGEQVHYGFLGVDIAEPDSAVRRLVSEANLWGVVVTRVYPDTPAHLAHLQEDDLIVEFSSVFVEGPEHLVRLVGATPAGETVSLLVYRDQQPLSIEVTIAKRDLLLVGSR